MEKGAGRCFFVTCAKGLEDAVAAELRAEEIGARDIEPGSSGVNFRGSLATGYRANLWLRAGVRVLEEFARGETRGPDELYEWARGLDLPRLMKLEQTFSVEARVWDSDLTHSKYAALRIKDALCDVFRERTGRRPNVNVESADLPLFLYVYRDEAVLYRDLSGTTLHKRGYRDAMHKSSLNEAAAAGLLELTGWDGRAVLCDPMCGAGTFVIEAALLALRRAPGLLRKRFPFESWPDFERALWKDCKARAHSQARYELPAPILANDLHPGALALARKDAEAAGVAQFIAFSQADVNAWEPPERPGLVTVNPPWGERLKPADLAGTWRALGEFLRRRCPGAEAWVLSGNPELFRHLALESAVQRTFRNGALDCRWTKYVVPQGGVEK